MSACLLSVCVYPCVCVRVCVCVCVCARMRPLRPLPCVCSHRLQALLLCLHSPLVLDLHTHTYTPHHSTPHTAHTCHDALSSVEGSSMTRTRHCIHINGFQPGVRNISYSGTNCPCYLMLHVTNHTNVSCHVAQQAAKRGGWCVCVCQTCHQTHTHTHTHTHTGWRTR